MERDASRMMVVNRATGEIWHGSFREFPSFLNAGDLVVLNNSKVIKARLLARELNIEVFLLERLDALRWRCLTKPARKMPAGKVINIAGTQAEVVEILAGGERIIAFRSAPDLEKFGHIPLPPYLKRPSDATDEDRYQTIYASRSGSVAAPTAGLHFTPHILNSISHTFLTLHVGAGTFLPVKSEKLNEHVMHEEQYEISLPAAHALNSAKRLVSVGTTVARVLESQPSGDFRSCCGRTNIFIYPPFHFQRVGALLTNFHLPHSTLLMLVCAFGGYDLVMRAYAEAMAARYRFYSYGDCMLLI